MQKSKLFRLLKLDSNYNFQLSYNKLVETVLSQSTRRDISIFNTTVVYVACKAGELFEIVSFHEKKHYLYA